MNYVIESAFDEFWLAQSEFAALYRADPRPADDKRRGALRNAILRCQAADAALRKLAEENGCITRIRGGRTMKATTSGVVWHPAVPLLPRSAKR